MEQFFSQFNIDFRKDVKEESHNDECENRYEIPDGLILARENYKGEKTDYYWKVHGQWRMGNAILFCPFCMKDLPIEKVEESLSEEEKQIIIGSRDWK